jgi:hypothetical protein
VSDIIVVTRNRLTDIVPSSGTRAIINTPSPSQDADFPMRNILEPYPEKLWKCASPHPATHDVDLDAGQSTTYRVVGITRNRQHNGGVGITNVEVFTGTGSTYPPTFTSRGNISLTPTDNDKALDFGSSITCKQFRLRITASGRYSCRVWLGRAAEYLNLGGEGMEVEEGIVRVRAPEVATYSGGTTYGELAAGIGAIRRRFRFSHEMTATTSKAIWLASLGGTVLMLYSDGVWRECFHVDPAFATQRAVGSTALETHTVVLESRA